MVAVYSGLPTIAGNIRHHWSSTVSQNVARLFSGTNT